LHGKAHRCLEPISIEPSGIEGETLVFAVTFRGPDGAVFAVQTPGNPNEQQSVYKLRVALTPEGLRVLDMPPFSS
jgi:hypothetical protein